MKKCRVCGNDLENHKKSLDTCLADGFHLQDWGGSFDELTMLLDAHGFLESWSQDRGLMVFKFVGVKNELATTEPVKDLKVFLLAELVPAEEKDARRKDTSETA